MSGFFSKTYQSHVRPQFGRISPAFLAAVAFVIVQVSIGIIFKIAQRDDGRYAFSQSSSIVISEFCKFLLSVGFFYRQCAQRLRTATSDDIEKTSASDSCHDEDHHMDEIKTSRLSSDTDSPYSDSDREKVVGRSHRYVDLPDADDTEIASSSPLTKIIPARARERGQHGDTPEHKVSMDSLLSHVTREISPHTAYGMAHLALSYAVINNSVFLLYRLADPGTISLVRSGITLITALTLMFSFGTVITKRQWVAILFQLCGVVVTQYNPERGALYPLWTYLLIVFQTTISACAGVYNQSLLKSEEGSLHVCNMALYAAGTLINMVVHLTTRAMDSTEPSFFQGYNSSGAVMVILSNVFIGLAITAVYKYSDALVKCFATAVSTGILLYVAPTIFHVPLSFLVIPGTVTVFAATWLYLDGAPPKTTTAPPSAQWKDASMDEQSHGLLASVMGFFHRFSPRGSLPQIGLTMTSSFTVVLIMMLASSRVNDSESGDGAVPVVESPFKDSLAYVRWNQGLTERLNPIMKYRPFFKEMHISMPGYLRSTDHTDCTSAFDTECGLSLFNNLTADNYNDPMLIYTSVAQTMQDLLDAPANTTAGQIQSLTYFHFDLWLDPMGFSGENFDRIWFPDGDDPRYECMTSESQYPGWWGWSPERNTSHKALAAVEEAVKHFDPAARLRVNTKEWCIGWSDIYYIPRHYFKDFIYLSRVFYAQEVVHEIAIPTMIHLIDITRRAHESHSHSVITHLSDCWGHCCANNPTEVDLQWHRCGHKLDFRNKTLSDVFFDKLDASAQTLGTPLYTDNSTRALAEVETIFDPDEVNAIMSKAQSIEAMAKTGTKKET